MPDPVTLHRTEDHLLPSRYVEDDFHLWIARPVPGPAPGSRPSGEEPPVTLWVLDGDLFFGTAVELTRLMHRLYGELPPVLVVGVSYGARDLRLQAELRTRDFTPTADAAHLEIGRQFDPTWEPRLPPDRRMGGAAPFLRFLLEEARPFVCSRFDVAPSGDVLFGSSLGGLFAIWSLLEEPGAFERVVAVSPALWWDDGTVFELEERKARTLEDLPVNLFLGVGALEEPDHLPFLARFRLVSNVQTLAARLEGRAYPSLSVAARVLDGETHTSVVPVGLTRGLRTLLRGPPPPTAYASP